MTTVGVHAGGLFHVLIVPIPSGFSPPAIRLDVQPAPPILADEGPAAWRPTGRNRWARRGQPGLAAHWDGRRWRVRTLPAVTTLSTDSLSELAPDGHGGMWAIGECDCGGPAWRLWHYTRGTWVGPMLGAIGGTFRVLHAIAAVPGTTSTWAVATVGTTTNSDRAVLLNGRIPR